MTLFCKEFYYLHQSLEVIVCSVGKIADFYSALPMVYGFCPFQFALSHHPARLTQFIVRNEVFCELCLVLSHVAVPALGYGVWIVVRESGALLLSWIESEYAFLVLGEFFCSHLLFYHPKFFVFPYLYCTFANEKAK